MKPNKRKGRLLSGLLAVIFCMAVFSVSASAAGYYASDESGSKVPPGSIDSITVSTENVELEDNGSNATTEIDGDSIDLDPLCIFRLSGCYVLTLHSTFPSHQEYESLLL